MSEITGLYKVLACQLKTKWLHPQIWSHYIWDLTETSFKLHFYNVCPSAYIGSFVHCESGQLSIDADAKTITFTPSSGQFEGQAIVGIYQSDDSGQILQVVCAFPGQPLPTGFQALEGQVYEVWQRVKSAGGTLV
jgi:hypothetical protein